MTHDRLYRTLEVKFSEDAAVGEFTGYGAVFGNVDQHGDVIVKGAFKETLREWKKQKRMPPMLVQHGGFGLGDMDGLAIGKWSSMVEDDTGLLVEGKLINLDTERGRTIHGALREGVLDGLSIGFRAKEFSLGTKPDEPRRTLKKIDLVELSVVQMPANGEARIQSVKSADDIKTIREFEDFLRDAGGYSRAAAKAIASHGFKATEPPGEDEADIEALVRRNIDILKP